MATTNKNTQDTQSLPRTIVDRFMRQIEEHIKATIARHFPIEVGKRKLDIKNIQLIPPYDQKWLDDALALQRDYKLHGKDWNLRIVGDVYIYDNGKLVSKKRITLANVPLITSRGTFIRGGVEYVIFNQMRRRPGIYVVQNDNGKFEALINSAKGRNFQIIYTDLNELQLEFGSRHFNLYNILKGLGVDDATLEKLWGKKNLEEQKTLAHNTPLAELKALYRQLYYGDNPPSSEKKLKEAILKYFQEKTAVEPDIVKTTLGEEFEIVGPLELAKTAAKLLRVAKGKEKPDNQNSIFFKSFHTPADLLAERFELLMPQIIRKLKRRLQGLTDPTKIMATRPMQEPFDTFWTATALTHVPDMSNLIEVYSDWYRVTPLGVGGYTNMRMLPLSARFVDNSHLAFIDPVHTPEGQKAGLMLYLTSNAVIDHGKVWNEFYDIKNKKKVVLPHTALVGKKVVFPDQVKWVGDKPRPIKQKVKAIDYKTNQIVEIPFNQADYLITHKSDLFSMATAFVPAVHTDHPNRLTMASKMVEQALPLAEKEPPLVRSASIDDRWAPEEVSAPLVNIVAPKDGVIKSIDTKKGIITFTDGTKVSFPVHFPFNTNTGWNAHRILVKPGDKVKARDVLVETNYATDDTLAYGRNLKVGYFLYGLYNLEDGVVISESAAKKLTSEHYYTFEVPFRESRVYDKRKYASVNPTEFTVEQLNKLNDEGVVKKGVKLNPGDPIAIYLKRYTPTPDEILLGKAFKALRKEYVGESILWEKPVQGEVVDVVKTNKGYKIIVRSYEPARVGDKLAGRHGNKGVITHIVPDAHMPRDESGEPLDIIISPLSIPSRINIGQLVETLAGKIAKKTNTPIRVEPFSPGVAERVKKMADKLGIKEKETVYDPLNPKRKIKAVVGYQYIMKLRQQSEKGLSGRGFRGPYDVNFQPIKGSAGGAKRLDWMTLQGLAAHGASEIIKEKMGPTSEYNPEFWLKLINGEPLPMPKTPFVTEKFKAMLAPAGIKLEQSPKGFVFRPITDQDILKISSGEIKRPSAVVHDKDLTPEKQGLFDPYITGGLIGDKWAHIKLPSPVPNPSLINAIAALLELSPGEVEEIALGRLYIDKDGKKVPKDTPGVARGGGGLGGGFEGERDGKKVPKDTPGATTGGAALERALKNINVDKLIEETRAAVKKAKGSTRDKLNKKLRYLLALKKLNLTPDKAYILHYVPVIPPKYRSIYPTASGDIRVPSLTLAYKDLGVVIEQAQKPEFQKLPEEFKQPLYAAIYKGVKAIAGLGDPIGLRTYTGVLQEIKGSQNKYGFYQSKILVKKQNVAGRAVIGGDPTLHLDEIGVPEALAWKIFEPLIIAEIKKRGKTYLEALKEYDQRTPLAKEALKAVLEAPDTYLLANRAPSLHQWNILAFKPKLIDDPENMQLKLHPMVLTPFNADFDGDAMNVFVPVTPKAKREAEKLLPSRTPIKWGHDKLLLGPISESMIAIYKLAKPGRKTKRSFSSMEALEKAVRSGDVKPTDMVTLKGKRTSFGIEKVKAALRGYWDGKTELTKKKLYELLKRIAKEKPEILGAVIDDLKDLSRDYMFDVDYSFGLEDLLPIAQKAPQILHKVDPKNVKQWDNEFLKLLDPNHPLKESVASGARGKPSQIRQLTGFIRPDVPYNFTMGLDTSSYWSIINEARAGVIGRSIETAKPGEVVKQLLAITQPMRIVDEDGPDPGLRLPVTEPSLNGRYLARPVIHKGKVIMKANELLTKDKIQLLKQLGIKYVFVKSPLTARVGITAKSFGLLDNGKLPQKGLPIGIIAAQAVGEPSAQLVLNKFHGTQGLKDPISEFSRVLTIPDEGPEFAALAPVDGKVVDITKRRTLRYIVIQDKYGKRHRVKVYPARTIKVKIGDKVTKGQRLTDGDINPKDIIETLGYTAAQNYLVDRMKKIYDDAGIKIDRRMFEVLARTLTDFGEVIDPGDDPYFVEGDVVSRSELERHNRALKQAGMKPIRYKPVIKGIHKAPFISPPRPFTAMVAGRIIPTLQEAAAMGVEEPYKQDSPVPMLVDPSHFNLFDVDTQVDLDAMNLWDSDAK